ncbi:MAG: hypothetical protein MUD03_00950 [Pirellula sp.]|jgi:hypothetical protein|nr:hypothetical protein [Pirellula sp.]
MSNLDSLAIHLIRAGQWSEAVCLYRDELGLSLPQAEQLVLRISEEYDLKHPGRLLSWLWIALAGFSILCMVALIDWLN